MAQSGHTGLCVKMMPLHSHRNNAKCFTRCIVLYLKPVADPLIDVFVRADDDDANDDDDDH